MNRLGNAAHDPAMFINGSPHAVTDLWDVGAHRYNLKFTCRRCGHSTVLHAAAVWRWFREKRCNAHLSEVPKRIVCRTCWETHHLKIRDPIMEITDEVDDPDSSLPLPSEREWKLEARRRR